MAPVIIVRRDESEDPPHHGGAWKVAYADFVTAMMAFFLLMWLLNATTEEQRTGLADYFAPTNIFGRAATGSGQPFGGKTPNDSAPGVSSDGAPQIIQGRQPVQVDVQEDDSDIPALPVQHNGAASGEAGAEGARRSVSADPADPARRPSPGRQAFVRGGDSAAAHLLPQDAPEDDALADGKAGAPSSDAASAASAAEGDAQREQRALETAGARLTDAIRRDPALADVAGQIMVDTMPEGLRIQIVDADNRAMFAVGSAAANRRVRDLMAKMAPVLAALPNDVSIAGHTDALSYGPSLRSNWDLSAERANAARRILVEAGLPEGRIRSVTGNADRDLLVPSDPLSPSNRRIAVVVLRHAAAAPPASPAALTGAAR
jgi:chemotaxis protein MotB